MKKMFLVVFLLLMCFFNINVRAEEEKEVDLIANDLETVEQNNEEASHQETSITLEEEKKDESVVNVNDEIKTEVETETTRDADVEAASVPRTVKVTLIFKEESNTGATINSGNGVQNNSSNTLSENNRTWTKISRALKNTTFSRNSTNYTVDGWYDENGNPVPESMWYDANTPTRIRASIVYSEDMPDEVTYTYILRWNEEKQPIYKINVFDRISTGSHRWSNTTGHEGTYTYTFQTPDAKSHYELAYYKMEGGEETFQPGEQYTHDISAQGPNTDVTENFYAYWKADVTLNLYDENKKLISSESSFESVSINYDTDKIGYNFLGWFDENDNEVTETVFYPNEMGIEPEPVSVTLYAKYELIKIDVGITKIWNDESNKEGLRPKSITVILLANGEEIDSVDLSGEGDEWTHTFSDLIKYSNGELIDYTIDEIEVKKYKTTIDGYTITNSREVETTEATVTKIWNDESNQDGKRPKSLQVTLSNGTKVTLNEKNNWTATVRDLPVYVDGMEIEYTWKEANVEGYELTDVIVDGNNTKLTNTHKIETTEVTVTKAWSDDNNESGKRPKSVVITLLADGVEHESVKLSEENKWTYTFSKLPVYHNGEIINYTVVEKEVPENYEVSYEGDMNEGFTIHNVLGQGDGEPEFIPETNDTVNNPQTGDNIVLYLITLIISISGIITLGSYIKIYD